jgi:nucleoside-diphosphate-sugar epimerase
VIPTIISQALSRHVIELGDTSTRRDFLYVEDTAAGMARCAEVPGIEGETINLGTGEEITIGAVAERVLSLLDLDVPIVTSEERLRPQASEVGRLLADSSKARRLLGWSPETDFDEGLGRTIAWVERFLSLYKTEIYNV